MASPGAPDSYRSLYLSRAISPQIGLKLMAFDTNGSSTLNPSSFIALTFQKVGLCVAGCAEMQSWVTYRGPWGPRLLQPALEMLPLPFLLCRHPTSSITATFMDITTQRLQIITPRCTFSASLQMGHVVFLLCFTDGGPLARPCSEYVSSPVSGVMPIISAVGKVIFSLCDLFISWR